MLQRTLVLSLAVLLAGAAWALYIDCDTLWLEDVGKLFALADPSFAVMAVKHDHVPTNQRKMDGKVQSVYPRKNWSSLMLFNMRAPEILAGLTRNTVNTATAAYLHRFMWCRDDRIGGLSAAWNWLVGISDPSISPKMVHFTDGGPWLPEYKGVRYAREWLDELALTEGGSNANRS